MVLHTQRDREDVPDRRVRRSERALADAIVDVERGGDAMTDAPKRSPKTHLITQ